MEENFFIPLPNNYPRAPSLSRAAPHHPLLFSYLHSTRPLSQLRLSGTASLSLYSSLSPSPSTWQCGPLLSFPPPPANSLCTQLHLFHPPRIAPRRCVLCLPRPGSPRPRPFQKQQSSSDSIWAHTHLRYTYYKGKEKIVAASTASPPIRCANAITATSTATLLSPVLGPATPTS
ncbi:hypothetical protein E2C01_095417 [Portunus trituberculatus]|uniref:Uncharacterized protein n=1 Tax=Portunus trituberculatus TaxID=210409 RepID=A0A5B7JSZ0_PORTR|nr:hypothetical protein [Portunus trituberculatus]